MPRRELTGVWWRALWILALVNGVTLAAPPHRHQHRPAQVMLGWDYAQLVPPIEGFLVLRRTDTGPWQEVGRVGATQRTFADTTAPRQTPLCYQVRAYRGAELSLPSNEVCLTIPAATPPPARILPGGRGRQRGAAP
jgi:hypothetical protein